MTNFNGSLIATVRCPICLDTFHWPTGDSLYEYRDGEFAELVISPAADAIKRADIMQTAYLRCPNPSEDANEHYLPAAYASYGNPLVIGLVGSTKSGKSHLLAAIIAEIQRDGLRPYGLTCRPVDFALHEAFLRERADPLVVRGEMLGATEEAITTYADALLVTSAAGTWPVAFFDVAGGDLAKTGKTARFVAGAGALIFVVDPDSALRTDADGERGLGDPTFDAVLGRLGGGKRHLELPAAMVVNKADRFRFVPPADVWLRRRGNGRVDAEAMLAESRDAYAFLYKNNANAWLRPFHECRRCTLHFVSATGGDPVDDAFPRGVRSQRVLEPVIALLAMTGILPGRESTKVGSW